MGPMSFQRYRLILLVLFALSMTAVWGLAFYLRPLDGDLTRVGGHTENAFHWTKPQQTFANNLFRITDKLEDYDRYYDVVVLGDSFTCDQEERRFGWQNFFVDRTGLSIIVLDTRKFWPLQVLESPAFRNHPPRFFVFESVERYLYDRAAYFVDVPPGKSAPAIDVPSLSLRKPKSAGTRMELRDERCSRDSDYVLGYLNAAMQRKFRLNNQVLKLPLNRGGLFSARNDRELLVYFDEVAKNGLTSQNLDKLREGMNRLQSLVESNGFTKFIWLIAPDKSSIYAPYLSRSGDSTIDLIGSVSKDARLHVVRTDRILSAEIAAGTPDVYLPNDSHWGSVGHRLAADGLVDYMIACGFLNNHDSTDAPKPP